MWRCVINQRWCSLYRGYEAHPEVYVIAQGLKAYTQDCLVHSLQSIIINTL